MFKKSLKRIVASVLTVAMMFTMSASVFASENLIESQLSVDDTLKAAGMSEEKIQSLDPDIKQFIFDDLSSNSDVSTLEYVNTEDVEMVVPYSTQVLTGITFKVDAFKSGDTIYIYPTYEFTKDVKPVGNDSFAVAMGDALIPYNYGGQLWYKDYTMTDWKIGGDMVANTQEACGAEYSGNQLGSPDYKMKFKGCAYVHAQVGSGSSKQFIMSYMNNPSNGTYSISMGINVGIGSASLTYEADRVIYTNAKTVILNY